MTIPEVGSQVEAALFNPAFVALVIAAAAKGYEEQGGGCMPYPLTFLIPGIALDDTTRRALPGNVSGRLSNWVLRNQAVAAAFPPRAMATVALTRAGLQYGLAAGAVRLEGTRLCPGFLRRKQIELETTDAQDCLKAAAFVGRWFGRTGDVPTIFGLLGVRP